MNSFSKSTLLLLAALLPLTATAADGGGYTVQFIWKYQGHALQRLKGAEPGGPGDGPRVIAGKADVQVSAEVRGTLNYTGQLGSEAERKRYDSWRAYGQDARVEAADVTMVVETTKATKFNLAEGEGDEMVNKANADLIGRVRHEILRQEVKIDRPEDLALDMSDLSIDRVANTLTIRMIDINPKKETVKPKYSRVRRMDKPAAAGEWDRSGEDDGAWRIMPALSPQGMVFDIPPGATEFTVTRTLDATKLRDPSYALGGDWGNADYVRDRKHEATDTLTVVVSRLKPQSRPAAAAASPAASKPAADGSATSPADTEQKPAETVEKAKDAVKKLRGLLKF